MGWLIGAVLALMAGSLGAQQRPAEVVRWTLDTTNAIRIGVREGAPEYELFDATGSARLSDGRIVVANAGARELRYYDPAGHHVKTSGGRGGGPGEFQYLRNIFQHTADTVLAADWMAERLSVFSPVGTFVHTVAVEDLDQADRPLGAWLLGPFWIAASTWRASRAAVSSTIRALPRPDGVPGFRFVLPGRDGTLWIAEQMAVGGDTPRWIVVGSAGEPLALVDLPARFDLHEAGSDYVLGRWRDADDVNFVHLYPIVKPADAVRGRLPRWMRDARPWSPGAQTPEVRASIASLLRNLTTAQEVYFAEHGGYGDDVRQMAIEIPEGITVMIVEAGRTGWIGAATHRDAPIVCGMAVGGPTPIGWSEGSVSCGESPQPGR
jgi:hypothetical protein